MLANNLQCRSLHDAMSMTFDGQHPCPLCKAIAAAKNSEQKNQFAFGYQKLEFPPVQESIVLIAPSPLEHFPRSNFFAKSFFLQNRSRPRRADCSSDSSVVGIRIRDADKLFLLPLTFGGAIAHPNYLENQTDEKNLNSTVKMGGSLLAGILMPGVVHACACGCGVFDVATSSMLPNGTGGMAWLQYDYMDQNQDWHNFQPASPDLNGDKEIETHFLTVGLQYMFSQSWGAQVEIPYDFRYFKGTDNAGEDVTTHSWSQLGDIRLEGIYSGFFADQSLGVTYGVKLPTGAHNVDTSDNLNNPLGLVDRDTQIGTGSTDILLGGFYRTNFTRDQKWDWFSQALLDVPTLTQGCYLLGRGICTLPPALTMQALHWAAHWLCQSGN